MNQQAKHELEGAISMPVAQQPDIIAWIDDPQSQPPMDPIVRPVPTSTNPPLPTNIVDINPVPPPQRYDRGTIGFRYWTAAEALDRGSKFWGGVLPGQQWQAAIGATLPVHLDSGVDLNAFYGREDPPGLSFFHDTVSFGAVFSGESPDVVCHEQGHAIVDAIRPELWNVLSAETAAFHESFGDMSAILCALQLLELRKLVLVETSGVLNQSSRLSRLAEQLGHAIRTRHPDGADPDCLRNAANSFVYRSPFTLPPVGPASQLTSEPHSFSRVFTAAFLDALAGMARVLNASPTEGDLAQAAKAIAAILATAVKASPIVPRYFSQVAAHMLEADRTTFGSKYQAVLKSAFVRRRILALQSAAVLEQPHAARVGVAGAAALGGPMPRVALNAANYGLGAITLLAEAPGEALRFSAVPADVGGGPAQPVNPEQAVHSFVDYLFSRGRVDLGHFGDSATRVEHATATKTHKLVQEDGAALIVRQRIDCGFGCSNH